MKFAYTLVFIVLLSVTLRAQLQITEADVENRIAAQSVTSYEATNADGMTFDLSGPVYDFTVFETTSETFQTTYVDPAMTMFPHEFPSATHAQVVEIDQGSGFSYLRLDEVGLYMLGFGTEVQGTDFLLKYSPERPQMLFPFKKGSSWTYASDVMSPFEGMTRVEAEEVEVIAEGTLRTPTGDYACLVVRQWERATTKIEFGGQVLSENYETDISYDFITKDGISASLSIDTLDESSGNPTLIYASWAAASVQTSAQRPAAAQDLRIAATYPNPVRAGMLSVDWSMDRAGTAQLAVVDIYGRVHRVLQEGQMSAGHHSGRVSVAGLSPGQYFLRLTQGSTVAMRPITIVH